MLLLLTDLDEPKTGIIDAVNAVRKNTISKVTEEFEYFINVCQAASGDRNKHL